MSATTRNSRPCCWTSGSQGVLDNETMVALLESFSHIRRMVEQAEKGARLLYSLRQAVILRQLLEG